MKNKNYILSLDQGTTSSRSLLIDESGNICASSQKEFRQIFPQPGWVEHDPAEIWSTQLNTARDVLRSAGIDAGEVAGIGITNQRETTIIWDRETGKPLCNAIVWQDRRTADYSDELKRTREGEIQGKTGLIPDAYFSATKIKWILENIPGAKEKVRAGQLAFGTVDSWLIWNLTGGNAHATDVTNASRTMLYNIHELAWDDELLDIFNIPRSILPEVRSCSEVYGETAPEIFGAPIPICGVAGDQQAALFGQMCTKRGMLKNTYGTGCFLMMNTGDKPVLSKNRLLSTIAWVYDGSPVYALEGSIFIGGAVVQWLRDGLKLIRSSSDVEVLAAEVVDNGGVYLVPAFAGLGAPHWDPRARGAIIGITRGTNSGHIARAALESIAFQVKDVLDAMIADAGIEPPELRVDGGASANNLLMQFQADIAGINVIRPRVFETTAMGAAFFAGLAVGFWKNVQEIEELFEIDGVFKPAKDFNNTKLLSEWRRAVERARDWAI
ncbi:glycerol kinase GlpK [bacterium]|nr:glycerol kinase GlpK [bacterium]